MNELKYIGYSVVFAEVPDEVSLAFSITGCPHRCPECHSIDLWEDIGTPILHDYTKILETYVNKVTCICLMGGDHNLTELKMLLEIAKKNGFKTCLYSGRDDLMQLDCVLPFLNYIKIGRYDGAVGGLNSPSTNQKFYKNTNAKLQDITYKFIGD